MEYQNAGYDIGILNKVTTTSSQTMVTTAIPGNESLGNETLTSAGPGRDEDLAKVEILCLAIILFLAVFGNGFVLLGLSLRRKKLTRMNILIVHLTMADLFVAVFNILPQLIWDITYRFQGNDFLCRSVKYFQVVAMYASAYVLVTTAVDRYLVICHPLTIQTWSTLKVHLLVLVAWILSLVFSIPQVVIFSYREAAPGVYDCWAEFDPMWTLQLYITWITGAIYIIPALLLCLLYGKICITVYRSLMAKQPSGQYRRATYERVDSHSPSRLAITDCRTDSGRPRAHAHILSRSKVKTVKLTLTVVACYLLCWGPFFVAQMWAAWDESAPFTHDAMVIILLMASLNSCTNPWIYMAFSDNICFTLTRWQHACSTQSDSTSRQKMSLLCRNETSTSRYDTSLRCSETSFANGALYNKISTPMKVMKKNSFVDYSSKNDKTFKGHAV